MTEVRAVTSSEYSVGVRIQTGREEGVDRVAIQAGIEECDEREGRTGDREERKQRGKRRNNLLLHLKRHCSCCEA
jgi:hypothetical protein